jgi:hypothetical protein
MGAKCSVCGAEVTDGGYLGLVCGVPTFCCTNEACLAEWLKRLEMLDAEPTASSRETR